MKRTTHTIPDTNEMERDQMNDLKPRATWFDDAHQIIDVTRERPGLPIPTISPARATFDYRHITHSEVARESVARAVAVLGEAFGVTFTPGTGTAGDDTPRYLLEAFLPSGLTLVIISRVEHVADQDDREDARKLVAA
jgi:hypothetical protein